MPRECCVVHVLDAREGRWQASSSAVVAASGELVQLVVASDEEVHAS